ncbi:TldD/PmbA family protein [Thermospira aquatica]|uniref:TldD/PmbA family protein n=1 Tax=Thermospira aquatica TaxID=2828656 RepID=A0AAX3BEA9_9SPIR|nr:metallopeptidase TldD-related protein [Thermospira aquatica]URA10560.1 TldD/PmbA family protein [Thermospira aquatica]
MKRESMPQYIEKVLQKISYGDVYASAGETFSVEFEMDRLKSMEAKEYASLGIRVFEKTAAGDYRVGQGFCNHEDDLEGMVQRAKEQSQWGEKLFVELPQKRQFPELDICRDVILEKEQAMSWGEQLIQEFKSINRRNKVFVSVEVTDATQWVANTVSFYGNYREKSFSLSCGFSHVDPSGELLYLGESESRFDTRFSFERYVAKIKQLFEWSQRKAKIPSGRYPVIFAPEALDTVLDPLLIALNGSSRYKKICRWEGMENTQVVDEQFTLRDDPFCLEVGDVYPFDDEGVVAKPLVLVEKGVLRNFIYDLATATRLGTHTTGHGRRSPSSLPQPEFSSLIVEPGSVSFDEMIRSIDRGLLVYSTLGGGMSNVVAGDFSVNVELGFLVEHGEVKGRVKDTMIRGNAFELFQKILFLGSEPEVKRGIKAPALAFDGVSVTGEDG